MTQKLYILVSLHYNVLVGYNLNIVISEMSMIDHFRNNYQYDNREHHNPRIQRTERQLIYYYYNIIIIIIYRMKMKININYFNKSKRICNFVYMNMSEDERNIFCIAFVISIIIIYMKLLTHSPYRR
jgi:hypothetical protein